MSDEIYIKHIPAAEFVWPIEARTLDEALEILRSRVSNCRFVTREQLELLYPDKAEE